MRASVTTERRKKEEGGDRIVIERKATVTPRWRFLQTESLQKGIDPGSAASAHMSPDIFSSFVKFSESKVIVADNTKLQVKGSGTVNIPLLVNDETRIVAAEDVLYVPKLSINLLSIPKIAEKGFTIRFDRNVCEILNGNGVVATVK